MRVMCCYVNLCPEAEIAVKKYAPNAEFVETVGLYGYNDAIAERWGNGDDLVVIEQDKVITEDVIPSFEACDEPWCSYAIKTDFPWLKLDGYWNSEHLGCTKFSASIQKDVSVDEFLCSDPPNKFTCPMCDGKGCWNYLDTRIANAIKCRNVSIHCHGVVAHLHDWQLDNKAKLMQKQMNDLAGPDWPY